MVGMENRKRDCKNKYFKQTYLFICNLLFLAFLHMVSILHTAMN